MVNVRHLKKKQSTDGHYQKEKHVLPLFPEPACDMSKPESIDSKQKIPAPIPMVGLAFSNL